MNIHLLLRRFSSLCQLIRLENVFSRHPGASRGPATLSAQPLDTGLRRYDGIFKRHLVVSIAALLAACGAAQPPAPTAAASHEEAQESLTHFSERTELFIEHAPLIKGQAGEFTVHLTRLDDFKPLAAGKLTVLLGAGEANEERFVVDAPAEPGLFRPAVSPKTAGERELTLLVESALGTFRHDLGPVSVQADAAAAEASHAGHDHGEEGIVFAKEQQWKADFATAEAIEGRVRPSLVATASLKARPEAEAQIVAPATGVLRAVSVRVGQTVKKGQLLATLSPRLGGDSDQATLNSQARKARIALAQARRERERLEGLFKQEAVAEKRLAEARDLEQAAEAEVEAAEARANQQSAGGGMALRAPIDAEVLAVSATSGAYVDEGSLLIHLADTRRLWLEARVAESDVGKLAKHGKPVGVSFTLGDVDHAIHIEVGRNGRLVAVGGAIDAASRTLPVVFEFANPGGLRLGMLVDARIHAGGGDKAVLIPASAVQDESGAQVVYVQTGGDRFERRLIQTGERDGERIAVLSGLEAGQRVVSRGGYLIRLSTAKAASDPHAGHNH